MKWLQPNKTRPAPPPHIDPQNPNIHRWENGLVLYKNFISASEEASIISAILQDDQWSGTGKRTTRHFGYRFDYSNNGAATTTSSSTSTNTTNTNDEQQLPSYISSLLPRLPIQEYLPDQFTVQYYPPGTGIPPHVDTHSVFGEAIYSLSLGSEVPMVFKRCGRIEARRMRKPKRCLVDSSSTTTTTNNNIKEGGEEGRVSNELHLDSSQSSTTTTTTTTTKMPTSNIKDSNKKEDKEKDKEKEEEQEEQEECESWELFLPPRSLLIMLGPSRYGYSHKIRGRKFDQRDDGLVVEREGRYSVTMRTVLRGEELGCSCDYPGVCDARIREEQREREREREREEEE